MEPLILLVLVAGAAVAASVVRQLRRAEQEVKDQLWEGWRGAAERLGLSIEFDPGEANRPFGMLARSGAVEVLTPLLDLARRLAEPEDAAARLGANLEAGEPEAGARLKSLRLLLGDFREHPATVRVLERLGDDPDPEIRLEVEIARGKGDEESLLAWAGHPQNAVAGVAARGLGQVGTARAVPALRALEKRGDRELAPAARQAIAEIQARQIGAEHGQLSLAGTEAGALSLVTAEEPGRLSLADEQAPEPVKHQESAKPEPPAGMRSR